MEEVLAFLPESLQETITQMSVSEQERIEEIRLRINRPLEVIVAGKPVYPAMRNVLHEEGVYFLNRISQYSLYTLEEEFRRGFITISGGHRIGIAGKVITENGAVKAIRDITSFNIRIAREKIGVAECLIPHIYKEGWLNTLLIGPPQSGKTTLLRDLVRIISSGNKQWGTSAQKVGLIDERSEIAGCVNGIPQHTFGIRLDVLDACPKAEGMMMMIRSMSPQIIVVDEIGRREDVEAIIDAVHAGIQLFVSIHGFTLEDVKQRPIFRDLFDNGVFDTYVELSARKGAGTIEVIRNKEGMVSTTAMEVKS
ncbi:stage III sporulation protein AA [Bacillus tianshenii]|nr:stage III sporulation protein AA [Bacillus tianshenii]